MALIYASAIVERCGVVYCDVLSITLASDVPSFYNSFFFVGKFQKNRDIIAYPCFYIMASDVNLKLSGQFSSPNFKWHLTWTAHLSGVGATSFSLSATYLRT